MQGVPLLEPTWAEGRLGENIVAFARMLRGAGIPVGPGLTLDALDAALAVGLADPEGLRAALQAVLVKNHEHLELYKEAFRLFWRVRDEATPDLPHPRPSLPDQTRDHAPGADSAGPQEPDRLSDEGESIRPANGHESRAALAVSDVEIFQSKDFAGMNIAEIARARAMIDAFVLSIAPIKTRRWKPDAHGSHFDARSSFRRSVRSASDSLVLAHRSHRLRPPPVVALCDISGSMDDYVRVFLHFMYALTRRRKQTQTFLFGTRLTNVTRAMRTDDVDLALARISHEARDWAGGTRIAASLRAFNRDWARRALSRGAIVLLFTDGLERDPGAELAAEADRLQRSCRRLIWLNPLLRYEGFEPRAQGVRALLPHVDDFRPMHNLKSLADLCRALEAPSAASRTRDSRDSKPWLVGSAATPFA